MPAGLFASNLKTNDSGFVASVFPVDLAYGHRFFLHNTQRFIGGSLIFGQAMTHNDKENTWQSVNLGLLVDINSLFYIGATYVADLRKGVRDPKWVAVGGVGPGLLQALKGKR